MTKLLGIRTVYNIDPNKTFRIADILEAGAIIPHSVKLDELKLEDLQNENCALCDGTGYKRVSPTILATCDHNEPEQCRCIEYAGDDPECPVHGWANEQEGSDTSTMTQLNDAGYGCGGIF